MKSSALGFTQRSTGSYAIGDLETPIVFIGLSLIFRDINPIRRAKMMNSPMLIHIVVIGSGLAIHGGSADGAMAAITSGVFSALRVRYQQRMYGYIRRNVFYSTELGA